MKILNQSEKGQAIVMIAFAIIGMLALIALAMDGGHAFSDRRQAQNAADASALAAAMSYAHDPITHPNPDTNPTDLTFYNTIAVASTTSNGYDGNLPRSTVALTTRAATSVECTNGGLAFQVDIDSNLPTWFGPVIGVSQVHNHVTSTSLGCKPYRSIAFNGNTIVATNKTNCKAMDFSGSSNTIIKSDTGQGIYTMSNCAVNALNQGGSNTVTAPNVSAVGGISGSFIINPTGGSITPNAPLLDPGDIWPKAADICPTNDAWEGPSGTINPGVFPGHNWGASQKFPPSTNIIMKPGIYCIDSTFSVNSNAITITGTDVTIVERAGPITINGGNINLSAPMSSSSPTKGLLFYLPRTNNCPSCNISITGNGNSVYVGSIIAPSAGVNIAGTSGTVGKFQVQVIGDTVSVGGGGEVDLTFDSSVVYRPPVPANIQLLK